MWSSGDRLTHRHNPELGVGRVVSADERTVVVEFPRAQTTLRLAAGSDALCALELEAGRRVRVGKRKDAAVVEAALAGGRVRLVGGEVAEDGAAGVAGAHLLAVDEAVVHARAV